MRESLRTLSNPITRIWRKMRSDLDPNDWRLVKDRVEGVCMTPLTTHQGRRVGSRRYIERGGGRLPGQARGAHPHPGEPRRARPRQGATGVECLAGAHLYRADPAAGSQGERARPSASARGVR